MRVAPVGVLHRGVDLLCDALAGETACNCAYDSSHSGTDWATDCGSDSGASCTCTRCADTSADRMCAWCAGDRVFITVALILCIISHKF
jgi:hypothetical protein